MYKSYIFLFSFFASLFLINACISIEKFGAIPYNSTFDAAKINSRAIELSFKFANITNKVACIYNKTFYVSATTISNMNGIKFVINGTLIAYDNITLWPLNDGGDTKNIFEFSNMNNFKIIANNGVIDGQGYKWWWQAILAATGKTSDNRPHMIYIKDSVNFELSGLILKNSPRYHIKLYDMVNIHMHHFVIDVDLVAQKNLIDLVIPNQSVPIFPLNTDGSNFSTVLSLKKTIQY